MNKKRIVYLWLFVTFVVISWILAAGIFYRIWNDNTPCLDPVNEYYKLGGVGMMFENIAHFFGRGCK